MTTALRFTVRRACNRPQLSHCAHFVRAIVALLLIGSTLSAASAESGARPRIGLVLGGGGARGFAHIGVLEELEKLRIPVDCIAGTSMGALVAGVYASGLRPDEMEDKISEVNWSDLFEDNPGRAELNYRDRRLSESYYPGLELGLTEEGLEMSRGIVGGQKLKLFFNRLVGSDKGGRTIENLPLPLSIIATDIGTGERVAYRDGDLTKAMRASMSVPGLLAPVDYDGRRLVDGGLVDNLPVGEVRSRCNADVVIAVNVGSPLIKPEDVNSLLSITVQMVNILTEQNVTHSLASLKAGDILIKPDLDGITATDFDKFRESAEHGRKAALAVAEQLKRYSVPEPEYLAWWKKVEGAERTVPRIDEIEIAGVKQVNPEAVTRHLTIRPGDRLDAVQVEEDLSRIFGDGYYEDIDYSLLTARERNILRITPTEKSWGHDYLRFGVQLAAADSEHDFAVRAAYHKRWINHLGGEWLTGIDIGQRATLFTEIYQPLDVKQRFFIEPGIGLRRDLIDIYQDGDRIAEYRTIERRASFNVGMNANSIGQIRLGWRVRDLDRSIETGLPTLPTGKIITRGWTSVLDFDQLDRAFFPSRGWAARVEYYSEQEQAAYSRLSVDLRAAKSMGLYTFNGRLYYVDSPKGKLPIQDAASLGGFLQLSGFATDQLIGGKVRFGSIRGERIIGKMPLGLTGDIRAGLSVETGKVDERFSETNRHGWQHSMSIFLGGETPVGPLYFGYGRVINGPSSIYLFLGLPEL
jgi:NTE family protein